MANHGALQVSCMMQLVGAQQVACNPRKWTCLQHRCSHRKIFELGKCASEIQAQALRCALSLVKRKGSQSAAQCRKGLHVWQCSAVGLQDELFQLWQAADGSRQTARQLSGVHVETV